jgi:hypothetical protein
VVFECFDGIHDALFLFELACFRVPAPSGGTPNVVNKSLGRAHEENMSYPPGDNAIHNISIPEIASATNSGAFLGIERGATIVAGGRWLGSISLALETTYSRANDMKMSAALASPGSNGSELCKNYFAPAGPLEGGGSGFR